MAEALRQQRAVGQLTIRQQGDLGRYRTTASSWGCEGIALSDTYSKAVRWLVMVEVRPSTASTRMEARRGRGTSRVRRGGSA